MQRRFGRVEGKHVRRSLARASKRMARLQAIAPLQLLQRLRRQAGRQAGSKPPSLLLWSPSKEMKFCRGRKRAAGGGISGLTCTQARGMYLRPSLTTHSAGPAAAHLVACICRKQTLAVVLVHKCIVPGVACAGQSGGDRKWVCRRKCMAVQQLFSKRHR